MVAKMTNNLSDQGYRFRMTTQDSPLEHVSQAPRQSNPGKAPVLVFLHGVGGNETNLMTLAPSFDERFHILSARAPINLGSNAFSWFEVQFAPDPVINPDQAEASRKTLIAFLENAVSQYNLEATQIYLAGFSQGAIIGASVSLTRPDLVAGLVMMSGRILPEIKPRLAPSIALTTQNIFVAHGSQDAKLPIRHAHASRDLLSSLGVNLTYREYEMGHEIIQPEVVEIAAWVQAQLEQSFGSLEKNSA